MSRDFRNLLWFTVGLVLGSWSVYSHAATTYNGTFLSSGFSGSHSSALAAATARCAYYSKAYVSHSFSDSTVIPVCNPGGAVSGVGFTISCPNGGTAQYPYSDNTQCINAPDCPSGKYRDWAGVCQANCVAPQVYDSVSRTCSAPPCPSGESMLNGECVSDTCPDGSARAIGGLCRGAACNLSYGPTAPPTLDSYLQSVCTKQGCNANYWKLGDGSGSTLRNQTGECDPGAPPDPACKPGTVSQTIAGVTKCYPTAGTCVSRGQCSGSVNNVVVCVPCGSGTTTTPVPVGAPSSAGGVPGSTKVVDDTVTPPGGPAGPTGTTSSTTSHSVVADSNGVNNVSTTTTTTSPDGTVHTQTTTQTQASFCTENPNAPLCKAADDECVTNPERVGCAKLGGVSDEGPLTSVDSGLTTLTPVVLTTNASCPANISLPKGVVVSWAPICDVAGWLKPLILAFAWLSAGLIVVGGVRT